MSALDIIRREIGEAEDSVKPGGRAQKRLEDARKTFAAAEEALLDAENYYDGQILSLAEWRDVLEAVETFGGTKEPEEPEEPEEQPEDEPEDPGLYGLQCRCIECSEARVRYWVKN